MKYICTRSKKEYSFFDLMIKCISKKRGLFTFKKFPKVNIDKVRKIKKYNKLFNYIFRKFTTKKEFKKLEVEKISKRVYCSKYFYMKGEEIFTLSKVRTKEGQFYLYDVSTGKTFSFKDVSISLLSELMEKLLNIKKKKLNILVSTSGDTGSSCGYHLKGKKNIKTFVFSPLRGVSEFQGKQMFSITNNNIFNITIKGNFDDCQETVKDIISRNKNCSTFNSINLIRIICQSVYYFRCFYLINKLFNCKELVFSIPTGNFGNSYSAYLAYKMGLPIKNIIIVNNENDSCFRLLKHGNIKVKNLKKTNSPSMDILIPSNIERYLFEILSKKEFSKYIRNLERKKEQKLKLKKTIFKSYKCNNNERNKVIYNLKGKYIDTHTASSIIPLSSIDLFKNTIVCIETAKYFKFKDLIRKGSFPNKKIRVIESLKKKRSKTYTFNKKDKTKINNFFKSNSF
ncbi:threonine synthase [Candidatus Vidania fulgoroideae]|uniref:Threonine synthase n=1 Tax=Candidatus Vidania fulgoroideorum TaxID=881286 RepID=A0A975ADU5_9PROT|nr:threonine synthase [Candidatus Vidania fulgoroideae]